MQWQSLLISLFVLVSVAQFDHTYREAATLNLASQGAADNNGRVTLLQASVSDQVVGAMCRVNSHSVTNVQINNGPFNSGTYFRVSISQSNSTLNLEFGSPDGPYYNILDNSAGSFTGSLGSCAPGSGTCSFDYYCENYTPSETPLEVLVFTSKVDDGLPNSINFYTLSVEQYTNAITEIPESRTFQQSTAVFDPFGTTFGPGNFVQYYHSLQPTVAEAGASSLLYIQANGISPATGTSYVCVSYDTTPATDDNLAGQPFNNNADIDENVAVSISSPSGCNIICQSGVGSVTLVIPACSDGQCGFIETLWIGVRTPSASTPSSYTMNISFRQRSLPDLVTIVSVPDVLEGEVLENQDTNPNSPCDGEEGDFSCNDYYQVSLSSIGNPTFDNRKVGPYLAVELFGVHNGEARLEVSNNYLSGSESLCPNCSPLYSCDVCDHCEQTSCWRVVQPCQWSDNLNDNWVITVEGVEQEQSTESIEYGLNVGIGSWPLETVQPQTWKTGSPSFGEVSPDHYHHYEVIFTADDIYEDSYFEVEMYALHEEDQIGFAWNYGNVADDGTCFGNRGFCHTTYNCDDSDIIDDDDEVGFCRFLFMNCPSISVDYDDFSPLVPAGSVGGEKVSSLSPGTYYFAVWGLQSDIAFGNRGSYDTSVPYTITWNLRRAQPIYDGITNHRSVYPLDYSYQSFVEIPDDPSIINVELHFSEIHNAESITHFVQCGALAGDCPCWSNIAQCSQSLYYYDPDDVDGWDCYIIVPVCECPERILYISSLVSNQPNNDNSDYPNYYNTRRPALFTITATFSEIEEPVQPFSVSRVVSTITDGIRPIGFEYYTGGALAFRDKIYRLSFTNVDPRFDALVLSLKVTPQIPERYLDQTGAIMILAVDDPILFVTPHSSTCGLVGACGALTTIEADGFDRNQLINAHCQIVLHPCSANPTCYDRCELQSFDNSFDQTREYFVTIADVNLGFFAQNSYFGNSNDDMFTYVLDAQVVEETPYVLNDGEPFYGYVDSLQYVHMVYEIPSDLPANTKLYIEAYSNVNQQFDAEFFVNYQPSGSSQLAGYAEDCYGSSSCDVSCDFDDDEFVCRTEISPCELSEQLGGSYYLSMHGEPGSPIIPGGPPPTQFGGDDRMEFTVTVTSIPTAPLLDGLNEIPRVGNVWDETSAFYSVTLPNPLATGSILGRILEIEVEAPILGNIFVTITQLQPDDLCDCPRVGHEVEQEDNGVHDDLNWKRYPCELRDGDVFYVSIDGVQNSNCDPVGFVVHASITNVLSLPITLSGNSSRIVGLYESSLSPNTAESQFTIEYDQYTVMTFSTNGQVSDSMSVEIEELANQFGFDQTVEVWLELGTFATRSGTNDDSSGGEVGPDPNNSLCPFSSSICTLTPSSPCRFFIDACSFPEGDANWFITFGGEAITLESASDIISVSIRHLRAEAIINTPALTEYTTPATSSNLAFADTVDRGFRTSYFQTVSTMGINPGDEVTFTFTGVNANSMYVGYSQEVSVDGFLSDCFEACSVDTPGSSMSCTVVACDSIPAATWYFEIVATTSGTGSFSISRQQSPAGTLTPVSLTLNTPSTFDALGANEWRYHTFTVPASNEGHFELQVTGGASSSNVVYMFDSSPIFLPGLALNPTTGSPISSSADSFSDSCGGFNSALPSGTCCYDGNTYLFAVVGSVGSYTLEVEVIDFEQTQTSISVPTTLSSQTASSGRIAWYSFSLSGGSHLWFDLTVTTGSAELYLNRGSRAGSDATSFRNGGDFGFCWGNDGVVGFSVCSGGVNPNTECNGFIPACFGCLADNSGSTFFFGVIPSPNATFDLTVIPQVSSQSLSLGVNSNLLLPVSATSTPSIVDDASSTGAFAPYSHYTFTFATSPVDIANFVPFFDDPEITVPLDFPNVRFIVSNFRNIDQATTAASSDVDIFISALGFAGSSSGAGSCYSGREITTGGNNFACLESGNGAASSSASSVNCSISLCQLGCPTTIFLSVAKSSTTFDDFSYTIDISNQFNNVLNYIDFVPTPAPTLGSSVQLVYSNLNSGNDVVYLKTPLSNLAYDINGPNKQFRFIFSDFVGDLTSVSVKIWLGDTCVSFAAIPDVCNGIDVQTSTCMVIFDPCTGGAIIDPNDNYLVRVERIGGTSVEWGFTITLSSEPVTNIDVEQTNLASPSTYQEQKEIFDFDWHFYSFVVEDSVDAGYNYLDISVDNLCCNLVTGDDLEVYFSFVETADHVFDNARPVQVATENCNNFAGVAPISNSVDDLCTFFGGEYRVGIFAGGDLQNYPDAILGVEYPALYEITADLKRTSYRVLFPECSLTQTSPGTPRFEVPIEATNRGAALYFELSLDRVPASTVTLFASKNANPWPRGVASTCSWGDTTPDTPFTDIVGDYFCSTDSTSCVIIIPECESSDNTWYLFVTGLTNEVYTVSSEYSRPYIPVTDLTSASSAFFQGYVSVEYQYYKFLVDSSNPNFYLQAQVSSISCTGCDLLMYVIDGPIGFAAGANSQGLENSPDCDGCNDRSCSTVGGADCVIETYNCNGVESNQIFIGILPFTRGSQCNYELDVSVVADVIPIVPDNVYCSSVNGNDFYQVLTSDGSSDLFEGVVEFTIVNPTNEDLTISLYDQGVAWPSCSSLNICTAGSTCSYEVGCIRQFVYITVSGDGDECNDFYSIIVNSAAVQQVETIVLGDSVSSDVYYAKITASTDLEIVFFSELYYAVGVLPASPNSDCVLPCTSLVLAAGQTYYFADANFLQIDSLQSSIVIGSSFVDVTMGDLRTILSVTPPTGVSSFTLEFEDVSVCRCGGSNDLSAIEIGIYRSTSAPTVSCDECFDTPSLLVGDGCNTFQSLTYSCVPSEVNYFTLANCGTIAPCPLFMRVRANFGTALPQIGGTHDSAFSVVSYQLSECPETVSYGFYTEVTEGILSVTAKEPINTAVAVSFARESLSGCSSTSCSAVQTSAGVDSSCRIDEGTSCNSITCLNSGTYYISVSLAPSSPGIVSAQAQVQVVNQYVDLAGSVSNSIIGEHKHFYRISNAAAAVSISFTISSGPPVILTLYDDCASNGFHETEVCAFGSCEMFIPTLAKHSLSDTFFLTIESGSISDNVPQWARNYNADAEKPTDYTVDVVIGSGNCAAPPTTGFCADPSQEGVNVFSQISNSAVWSWIRPDWKDSEAECRFNELLDECPTPTQQCRTWLKIFSCLISFPQCDGSGFQLGMCRDVCNEVEKFCGPFAFSSSSNDHDYACCSDRYVDVVGNSTTTSTCYNIPPPPPPPPAIDQPIFDDASSALPPSIDVPEFSTIFAYIAPASFEPNKDAELEREVVASSNGLYPLLSLLFLALALI